MASSPNDFRHVHDDEAEAAGAPIVARPSIRRRQEGRFLAGDWSLVGYIENASPFAVGGEVRLTCRPAVKSGGLWAVSDPGANLGSGNLFAQAAP